MNDDTISRKAAIDALWKALYEYEDKIQKQFFEEELNVYECVQHRLFVQNMSDIDRQTILNLPSSQPERKVGKLIKMSDADGEYWACNECGEDLPRKPKFDPQFDLFPRLEGIRTNYCPNCGADLRERRDDAEIH